MCRSVSLALITVIFALSGTGLSPVQAEAGPCRPGQGPDLRGMDFTGAARLPLDLRCADLTEARLAGVELPQEDLTGAILRGADLRQADLTQATLRYADLRGADLSRAGLGQARLAGADFTGALVEGAFFTRATGADLAGSRGVPADAGRMPGFRDAGSRARASGTGSGGTRPGGARPIGTGPGTRAGKTGPGEARPIGSGRAPSVGLVMVVFSAAGLALTMVIWGVGTRRSRRNALDQPLVRSRWESWAASDGGPPR